MTKAGPPAHGVLTAFVHKLASPLGALVNCAYLLPQDDEVADVARDAIEDIQQLLRGVRRWLDAEGLEPALEPTRPEEVLEEAHGLLPDDVRAAIGIACEPLPAVRADRAALAAVFGELLDNARRHAQAAEVRVSVRGRREGDRVVIELSDDGPGWTAEEAERAFEPFRGLGNGTPRAGMGLATVATMLSRQGGRAWGRPGPRGACIALELEGIHESEPHRPGPADRGRRPVPDEPGPPARA